MRQRGRKEPRGSLWSIKRLRLAKPTPILGVHLQQGYRRPTNRRLADNHDPVTLEVLLPVVPARVKQPHERTTLRVKRAQVWPLMCIAMVAGQGKILGVVASAMLASNDVLDVVGKEGLRRLG